MKTMGLRTASVACLATLLLAGPPVAAQSEKNKRANRRASDINAIGHRDIGKGLNFYSLDKEKDLGKQLAKEVERSARLVNDPIIQGYIDSLAERIQQNADARVPIVIELIDSPQPDAFSLPGGFLYINSGLILQTEREAELAGVIAHQVAHVALRHGTMLATKGGILELATVPLILLGPGGWAGHGVYQGINLAIPLTLLKFYREAELDADYFGLQYVYKAGYDPQTFVSFSGRLQDAVLSAQTQKVPEAFSPYPPPKDRIRNMEKEIARILPERQQSIVSSSEFDAAKERLKAIITPHRPSEEANKPTLRTRSNH